MQYGFVIDHSRCIGCHACTVACKAENDVPLGSFRTWVKYTEQGQFPQVRRSFAVLRCNQCSHPPCVTICPVGALHKRTDGIVDIDPQRCIGCKACMQACPYDALYIHPDAGVAQKCHFCAHRVERGMAPACAVVCPTEAIIPGDFNDRSSVVYQLRQSGELSARKTEAGTGPNVLYRDAEPAGLRPEQTQAGGGFLWANQREGLKLDAHLYESLEQRASARTVYDVEHATAWGRKVTTYLFTKSIAAGMGLLGLLLLPPLGQSVANSTSAMLAGLGLLALVLTSVLLVADLKRPERFWFILRYPNWDSWLTRGTVILVGYGLLLTVWGGLSLAEISVGAGWTSLLVFATAVFGALTAIYTAWLFRQAKGRVLWMRRGFATTLAIHAVIAGAAVILLLSLPLGLEPSSRSVVVIALGIALALQLVLLVFEGWAAPPARQDEYQRYQRLIHLGPFAYLHWGWAVAVGTVLPLLLLLVPASTATSLAAAAALVGLWWEQDNLVRAGQALAIS